MTTTTKPRRKLTKTQREAMQREALRRARESSSPANDAAVIAAFAARGIFDVEPRENVLTFNAWKALGRSVKKGEKSVKVTTWAPIKDKQTGQPKRDENGKQKLRPVTASVFHISQTKIVGEAVPAID
jgi:antirestriction protein ArdC